MLIALQILLSFIFCFFVTTIVFVNNRVIYNFNPQWKIVVGDPKGAENSYFNDSDLKSVNLPYALNQEEAFKLDIHHLSTGIVWYRRHFKNPVSDIGKKVFLEFEGIRQGGEFYFYWSLQNKLKKFHAVKQMAKAC